MTVHIPARFSVRTIVANKRYGPQRFIFCFIDQTNRKIFYKKDGSLWIPGSCLERVIPPAYLGAVSSFFCLPSISKISSMMPNALKRFATCAGPMAVRTVVRLGLSSGFDDTQPHRQRYHCHGCDRDFDDLTGTVLAGHHQPLRVWILCLYFMGLNCPTGKLPRNHLRQGLVAQQEPASLQGEVECDSILWPVIRGILPR